MDSATLIHPTLALWLTPGGIPNSPGKLQKSVQSEIVVGCRFSCIRPHLVYNEILPVRKQPDKDNRFCVKTKANPPDLLQKKYLI